MRELHDSASKFDRCKLITETRFLNSGYKSFELKKYGFSVLYDVLLGNRISRFKKILLQLLRNVTSIQLLESKRQKIWQQLKPRMSRWKTNLLVILLIIFYKKHVSFQILMLGTCECCVTQSVPRVKRSAL